MCVCLSVNLNFQFAWLSVCLTVGLWLTACLTISLRLSACVAVGLRLTVCQTFGLRLSACLSFGLRLSVCQTVGLQLSACLTVGLRLSVWLWLLIFKCRSATVGLPNCPPPWLSACLTVGLLSICLTVGLQLYAVFGLRLSIFLTVGLRLSACLSLDLTDSRPPCAIRLRAITNKWIALRLLSFYISDARQSVWG